MALFSSDPAVAKKQMLTVVFMLTAFGHMDGKFSLTEKRFLQEKIGKLVEDRVNASSMDPLAKQVAIERTTAAFQKVAAKIDKEIAALYTESVAEGESIEQFVYTKLALRCYELLKPFDALARGFLFEIVDELIMADGVAHAEEARLRDDIQRLLDEPIELEVIEEAPDTVLNRIEIVDPQTLVPRVDDHPFFTREEHVYARDKSPSSARPRSSSASRPPSIARWLRSSPSRSPRARASSSSSTRSSRSAATSS